MAQELKVTLADIDPSVIEQFAITYARIMQRQESGGASTSAVGGGGGASTSAVGGGGTTTRGSRIDQVANQSEASEGGVLLPPRADLSNSGKRSSGSSLGAILNKVESAVGPGHQSRINRRQRIKEEEGLIPSYFGGKIGWQQGVGLGTDFFNNLDRSHNGVDRLGNLLKPRQGYGQALRGVSSAFSFVDDNATNIETLISGTKRIGRGFGINGLEQTGMSLGASPGTGGFGSSIGPARIGLLAPTGREAISAGFDSFMNTGFAPGITRDQDMKLKQDLASAGYRNGTDAAESLLGEAEGIGTGGKEGLRYLSQIDPRLADVEMMDKAARYGNTNMKAFVKTLASVPSSAGSAKVSIEQMLADMKAMGDWSRQNGGTYANGAALASNYAADSGRPSAVLQTLLGSGFGQGQLYMQQGLAPFEQGTMNPQSGNAFVAESIDTALGMAGTYEDDYTYSEDGTLLDFRSGDERQAAVAAEISGLDAEVILQEKQNRQLREMSGAQEGYLAGTQAVQTAGASANLSMDALYSRFKGNNKGFRKKTNIAYNSMEKVMEAIENNDYKDEVGNDLFDEETREKLLAPTAVDGYDASKDDLGVGDDDIGNIVNYLREERKVGVNKDGEMVDKQGNVIEDEKDYVREYMDETMEKNYDTAHRAARVTNAKSQAQKEREAGEVQPGQLGVIELSEQAQMWFRMLGPEAAAAASRNSGLGPYSPDAAMSVPPYTYPK
jgi:hypothetical protein